MKTQHYEITVRGRLSPTLVTAFDDLTAHPSSADTLLRGDLVDRAALFGVLERIDALGLELLDIRSRPSAR